MEPWGRGAVGPSAPRHLAGGHAAAQFAQHGLGTGLVGGAHAHHDFLAARQRLQRRVGKLVAQPGARVKALEAAGVISRYVALASSTALGLGLNVFISISLKTQSKEALADFERRIAEHDEVMECYLMTGDSDYLIRVALADMAALEPFILEQLSPIPGVEKIRSSFALKQVRYKTALPLPHARG